MLLTEQSPPARKFDKVCAILDRYERRAQKLIPILQAVQDEYRYLPEEVLTYVATSLGVPPAKVYGVATFYAHFAMEPKGRFVIRCPSLSRNQMVGNPRTKYSRARACSLVVLTVTGTKLALSSAITAASV